MYVSYVLIQRVGPNLFTSFENKGIDGFPSWIWFTYKPNHTNTIQLSDKQKKELFQKRAMGLDIYSR